MITTLLVQVDAAEFAQLKEIVTIHSRLFWGVASILATVVGGLLLAAISKRLWPNGKKSDG